MKAEKLVNGEKFMAQLLGARDYIESKVEEGKIALFIHITSDYDGNPYIMLEVSNNDYGSGEIKVRGKNLDEIMDEFNRRSEWQSSQDMIMLAAPNAEVKNEDEIPF